MVVVPPGALTQLTTLGIARNSVGAPAAQPAGNPAASAIYEFTPHGLVFNVPVTIRIPMPSGGAAAAFMASLGEDWQVHDLVFQDGREPGALGRCRARHPPWRGRLLALRTEDLAD